jgi:uncharacterized protein (UPF0303 family)
MNNDILAKLLLQEEALALPYFNHDIAWQLGNSLKLAAEKLSVAVTIEVYAFEQVLFSYAMPGTTKENQNWVRRKRQSVMRFGHSSLYLAQYNATKQREFESQLHIDANEYCAHGGAFPIRIKGSGLIGVLTISGIAQEDDHNLVVEVISKELDLLV